MEFVGFMFFSFIEGLSVYALILYLFRFDALKYFWHIFFILTFIDLQNYVIHNELSLNAAAPIINIVITVLFLTVFIRIPLLWSMVMTLFGYIAFSIIQSSIVFFSFGYFAGKNELEWKAYLVQFLTGMIGIFLGWLLYKLGYGFSFSFEKLRFRGERMFIVLGTSAFLITLAVIILYKNIFINLIIFGIMLFVLLIFSLRKELEDP